MFFRRLIHIFLITTLVIQLLPTRTNGRLFMFEDADDEYTDVSGAAKQLRQLTEEEQHKDIHIEYHLLTPPVIDIDKTTFHFSETLPVSHAGEIHTPPPNQFG